MTEQKLTEQAEAYADKIDDGNRTARQCAILAYKKGFETKFPTGKGPINGVWHPMDEYPAPSVVVIIVTGKKHHFKHSSFIGEKKWLTISKSWNAWKWAYREDLL